MKEKIHKIQLFTLFSLTLTTFIAFYYGDAVPDSMFEISSNESELTFLSYYLFSLIRMVGFYTGPWLLFCFMALTLCYAFVFSRRKFLVDQLFIFPLLICGMLTCYLISPIFLGEGLRVKLTNNFSNFSIITMCIFSWPCVFAIIFRNVFKEKLIVVGNYLIELPIKLADYIRTVKVSEIKAPKIKSVNLKDKFSIIKSRLRKTKKEEMKNSSIPKHFPIAIENHCHSEINEREEEIFRDQIEMDLGDEKKVLIADKVAMYKDRNSLKRDERYFELTENFSKGKKRSHTQGPDESYFRAIIGRIEDKLTEFKIEGIIINVLKGPVVDTFELELGSGVKVSKITGAAQDLSLALYGAPIRIVYPMEGRTTVGIEVPRNPREIIYLDEVLNSEHFKLSNHRLPVGMGKNAFGETLVVDLAAMPHMLVAGATGAGKSVFINTLLVSLLAKKSPKEMKLILIDPKQLELALYAKLPHLVMPVVTDAKTASISLLWACQEMERRYSILKEFGVRNIEGFNEKLKSATPEMISRIHALYEEEVEQTYKLPYLVIIVDEFADLILTKAGKEIEQNICRLAAKARAAGVHLVIATQRPSVDVITGLIKSNFPTRVSFRVTTSVDSRTILNSMGAESLLGKGDMLYKHGVKTSRVHASYVDEVEIEELTNKLVEIEGSFHPGALNFLENGGEEDIKDEYSYGSHLPSFRDESSSKDAMYDDAVKVVMEHRSASASMLQRRLKIGYNRAANLIEVMESNGVVGPAQGSRPRKVLYSSEANL